MPVIEEIPEAAPLLVTEYPFTHHRVTLSVYRGTRARKREGREWHAIARLAEVPLAAAHRRALERLLRGGPKSSS